MTSIVASANDNFEKRSNKSFKTVQRENLDQNEIIDVRPKNVEQQKNRSTKNIGKNEMNGNDEERVPWSRGRVG